VSYLSPSHTIPLKVAKLNSCNQKVGIVFSLQDGIFDVDFDFVQSFVIELE
jgi:hypothetical protein